MLNMKEQYSKEVVPALQKEFSYKNVMQVPRIEKITLNMGVGEAVGDKKLIENAIADLEKLAGQKAVITKAKKSVAGFKIREGWPIGCKVTLRGERMWDFFDRSVDGSPSHSPLNTSRRLSVRKVSGIRRGVGALER